MTYYIFAVSKNNYNGWDFDCALQAKQVFQQNTAGRYSFIPHTQL